MVSLLLDWLVKANVIREPLDSYGMVEILTIVLLNHSTMTFLHEPGNEDELVRQILRYEGFSAEQREEVGRAARERLIEKSSPEIWKKGFLEIYDRVIR